jgi:branched-chain amino acid transport system ATP-binding protein
MLPDNLLQVRGLSVFYGQSHILQGVELDVGARPVSLIGRNGMGKSTLCLAIMGLIPAAAGSIEFEGRDLVGRKPHQIAAAGIGYVPQGRRIFGSLSVHEHLRLVERGNGARWTEKRIYELFPALAARRSSGGTELSGGEQQMLAIARALLTNPRLLLMDEPSEGLAPVVIENLVEVLRGLAGEGIGVLLVEQNLAVATAVSDELAVMVTGRIALRTSSAGLLADEAAQRRYLGVSAQFENVPAQPPSVS